MPCRAALPSLFHQMQNRKSQTPSPAKRCKKKTKARKKNKIYTKTSCPAAFSSFGTISSALPSPESTGPPPSSTRHQPTCVAAGCTCCWLEAGEGPLSSSLPSLSCGDSPPPPPPPPRRRPGSPPLCSPRSLHRGPLRVQHHQQQRLGRMMQPPPAGAAHEEFPSRSSPRRPHPFPF